MSPRDLEDDDRCPNCGQYLGGDSVCPNCGAILHSEDDEFEGFQEEEGDLNDDY